MPTLTEREVTPRMAEANHQNAQNSTGPRTPEGKKNVTLNALKHGLYGKISPELLMAVGEDPKVFERLRADHRESFYPFTPTQHMLCDELALLRWGRLRNQRAQTAQINSKREEQETDIDELRRQYNHDGMSFNRAEVLEKGMANMPDCPAKFEQMLVSLKVLLEQVENKEFKVDASPTLRLLYGQQPSLRANFFFRCLQAAQKPDKSEYVQLHDDLIDEQIQWNQRYQFYVRRNVEISTARRNLCFAPTEKVWTLLLRQEAYSDRQIERKTRLLWAMQEEDLRRKGDPVWQEIIRQQEEEQKEEEAEARQGDSVDRSRAERRSAPATTASVEAVGDKSLGEISEQSRQPIENKGSVKGTRHSGTGLTGRGPGVRR
jgi:hypothetical protein